MQGENSCSEVDGRLLLAAWSLSVLIHQGHGQVPAAVQGWLHGQGPPGPRPQGWETGSEPTLVSQSANM